MFLSRYEVQRIVEQAIRERKILRITYQHGDKDQQVAARTMAPFDIGTTNLTTYEQNRDNVYMFCFEHVDKKTGLKKPIVHAVNINHVMSASDTGQQFDPVDLTEINKRNTGYDYRRCRWAIVRDRDWY